MSNPPPVSPPAPPSPTPLKQLLIGYSSASTGLNVESPTDGESDRVFDAPAITTTAFMNFYSYVPNADPTITPSTTVANRPLALGIQGRPTFNRNHFFKLGYTTTEAGTYIISTTNDGIFSTTPYYIFDTQDNQRHSLPYSFPTGIGTFDNRLQVVFENLTQISS